MKTHKIAKPTLLSPCGSFAGLQAAINGGADAVYFGIDKLNMRSNNNNNFTLDDLGEVVSICRNSFVRCYITLNTVMFDHDLVFAKKIVKAAKQHGVDAIIAHDVAVLMMAHDADIPVHISTQANVTNIQGVKFYSAWADVIVLARELTLEQVRLMADAIRKNKITGPSGDLVKLEVFVHGALCMATSGKCYLSLHTNFASANRGSCVQNCRRKYTLKDTESGHEFSIENEYIMSAKDLRTISFMDQLVASGASIFKIEGRGRSEEYIQIATKCYREALDAIANNTYSQDKITAWNAELDTVFNRGAWEGYYLGRKEGEWHNAEGSASTKKKVFVGKNLHYYPRARVAEIKVESGGLSVGDELMISGNSFGVHYTRITEMRVNDFSRKVAWKGEVVTIPVAIPLRETDKIYKIVER
jgi:putative protease